MSGPRVAVVGASGFIGSAVVEALERRGAEVVLVRAPRILADVHEEEAARRVASEADEARGRLARRFEGCDAVVNAAGVPDAAGGHAALAGANAVLPGVVGDAATLAGVRRLVHVSSAGVQGRRRPLDESAQVEPFSPYTRTKALGERLVLDRPGAVVYRPTSVHGPSRPVTGALVRFAGSRLASVSGSGLDPTPQVLVENVADAIAFVALHDGDVPAVVLHPAERVTTRELLETLGGRSPARVPPGLARMVLLLARWAGGASSRVAAYARRLEMLWIGQPQVPGWLDSRWSAPVGREGWRALGRGGGAATTGEERSVLVLSTVSYTMSVFLVSQIEALRSSGWRVELAAGDDPTAALQSTGARYHRLPLSRQPGDVATHLRGILALRSLLRGRRFDAVYVHTPIAAAVVRVAARLVPAASRPAVVYFAHGFHFLDRRDRDMVQRIWYVLERSLSALTARLIVINDTDVRSIARWPIARSGRVRRLRGVGVDPDHYGPSLEPLPVSDPGPVTRWVTLVAEFTPNKRHRLLIEALALLPADVGLLLAGSGVTEEEIRDEVERRGWSQRVRFLGFREDVRSVYAASSVVVLVSAREGLPRCLMEALCMGVPVAVTRTRGAVDIAEAVGCPVADSATPEAVAAAISEALADGRTREALRSEFLSTWHEGVDEVVTRTILGILEDARRSRGEHGRVG